MSEEKTIANDEKSASQEGPSGSDSGMDSSALSGFAQSIQSSHPRLYEALRTMKNDPLSGNTLRVLLGKDGIQYGTAQDIDPIQSLGPPILFNRNSTIVVSHFMSYRSQKFSRYWNTIFPDIQEQYGDLIRYEHHDAVLTDCSPQYKIASIGRAIQDRGNADEFWHWFDYLMQEGAGSFDEALSLVEQAGVEVNTDTIKTAIHADQYKPVIETDVQYLYEKEPNQTVKTTMAQINQSNGVFRLYINGTPTQPTYDSIIRTIQRYL